MSVRLLNWYHQLFWSPIEVYQLLVVLEVVPTVVEGKEEEAKVETSSRMMEMQTVAEVLSVKERMTTR